MKKSLEEELESAATAPDEASHPAEEGVTKPVPPESRGALPGGYTTHGESKSERNVALSMGLLAILLAMAGGIVALVLVGFKEAAVYAMPADQLLLRANELRGRKVRVEGELVPGTLQKQDSPCEYRFTMQAKGQKLDVSYAQCAIPDTFRDRPEGGVMVTVEGALAKTGTFDASLVMAKCSSKYDPKTHEIVKPDGTRVKASPSANLDDLGG